MRKFLVTVMSLLTTFPLDLLTRSIPVHKHYLGLFCLYQMQVIIKNYKMQIIVEQLPDISGL